MAGNTKLVGFLSDNRIQLERWGTSATIQLDDESVQAIRRACFEQLPQRPTQSSSDHLDDFGVRYDSGVGRIQLELSTDAASLLADLLDVVMNKTQAGEEERRTVQPYVDAIRKAVQAHKDFHDRCEPGVQT